MITTTFLPVVENNQTIAMRLTVLYNGKYVTHLDYAPDTVLSQDEMDNYIAGKFSAMLS